MKPIVCSFHSLRRIGERRESGHTVDPNRYGEHKRRLESAGIDVASGRKSDQLELRNWGDTHLRGGKFHPDKTLSLFEEIVGEAKHKAFPLLRFVTQMEWVLETDMDLKDLLEYEAKANHVWLGQEGPVNPVVCTYDLRRFRGDVVVDIMRMPPLVIIGGILQENPFCIVKGIPRTLSQSQIALREPSLRPIWKRLLTR